MAMGKHAHEIWRLYPKSHIRFDVTEAGRNSYHIKLTLLDVHLKPIHEYDHFGSGNLKALKKEAVKQLARSLKVSTA